MRVDVSEPCQFCGLLLTSHSAVGEEGKEKGESEHARSTLDTRITYAPKHRQQLEEVAICYHGDKMAFKGDKVPDMRSEALAFRSRHVGMEWYRALEMSI